MCVYTQASLLAGLFVCSACLVGYAVFRAGNGCFGLAIQHYGAVQVRSPRPILLLEDV
jgi:hypothetical protein